MWAAAVAVLSEPLARLGATVTGLDPAPTNIAVGRASMRKNRASPWITGKRRIEDGGGLRRAIRHSSPPWRVVEHVTDVPAFVESCCAAVKPVACCSWPLSKPHPCVPTRSPLSAAEYILRWLPRGTHQWEKFVTPDELADAISAGGMTPPRDYGVVYNPLADKMVAVA